MKGGDRARAREKNRGKNRDKDGVRMKAKDKNEEEGVFIPSATEGEQVVVKFKEEAGMRYASAEFSSAAEADVSSIRACLEKYDKIKIERMFDETEDELDREVASLRSDSGQDVPTLSGYYTIVVKDSEQAAAICAELDKDPLVEEVYIEPPAVPAIFDEMAATLPDAAPPATPNFRSRQGYLDAAPKGVNAPFAWTYTGGKGGKVQVIDVEGGWNFSHEDLLQNQGGVVVGTPQTPSTATGLKWWNHGTAVQGEISGDENSFGIVGIAPNAKFSGASIFGSGNSSAKAIKTAANKLSKGDVILIELHRAGPNYPGGLTQFGYIAIEWWSADFNTVKYATAKGIIVIAAAGNGSQNLDDAVYLNRFDRTVRDSGAILVGAGAPPSGAYGPDRSRLGFSNYGAIVDAQGWGREVTTTGYGNLQGGSNKNEWYTKLFSGTSSASPIVVGAVACLQSIRKAQGTVPFTYAQLRDILRKTGSPQTDAPGRPKSQRIGNRPDLKAAITKYFTQTVSSGIATKYWDECVAYPPGSTASLWLYVNNSWKHLDNPSQGIKDMVQRAFLGSGSKVRVWYSGSVVVGLVVEGS